jgi:hypothetical protein
MVSGTSRPCQPGLVAGSVARTLPYVPDVATESAHTNRLVQDPADDGVATESVHTNMLVQDPADKLTELLSWSGELTKAMAAERAETLLQFIRNQTEELAIAKSELLYLKWKESLKAEVSALLDSTNPLPCCADPPLSLVMNQRSTRAKLEIQMQTGKHTLHESHMEQSRRIADIVEACSELKPLTSEKEQPNLHLLYVHAVALTEGTPQRAIRELSGSYPGAIRELSGSYPGAELTAFVYTSHR